MQQNKKFLRVLCSLLAAALAAWCTVLLCRWVGYDLQERLGNTPSYEIINDDYSQIIDIPAEGLTQAMPLKAGQPFYGVRFKFSTHGQLYKSGMTMVVAYNEAGEQILFAAGNFLNIWDDTFTEFTCNEAYIPDHDETLTIRLYNESAWDGPLGVWASEGEVSGMPLSITDGDTLNATMAMQRVSDFTGSWPAALAARLQKPLAAAVFIAVLLAMLHAPLYLFVPAVGLALGVTFTYVTPALVAPDEYTHLAAAYELASTWSGQTAADEDGNLLLRECDAAHFGTKTGDIGVLAYKNEAIAETSEPGSPDVLTTHSEVKAGQGSGSYLAQALGIRLARAQGKNFYTMLLYGRLANLILYLLLAALAVWLAPTSLCGLFACVALLPMPLQLAASLSPDAAVLGLVFSFTALCLRLRGEKAVWWQKILLIVLGGLTAPGKAIYLPVILLCLLIPAENLTYDGNPTVKFLGEKLPGGCCIHAATLVLAFCFWLAANLNPVAYAARDMNTTVLVTAAAAAAVLLVLALAAYLKLHKRPKVFFWCKVAFAAVLVVGAAGGVYAVSHMGGGLDPDQLTMTYPNGDSIWTFSFGYICRNIPATVKLLLRTLPEQGALWLQGLLGTTLGEPIVYRIDVSWLLGVGLLLAVLAAALPRQDEPALLGRRSKAGTAGICLCVVLAVLAAALNWTPINYQTLFGLQGRYLLPILPLALLLVKSSKKLALRRDASRAAALCTSTLTMLTLLQGFGLYAAWQPVS
ncbi:DUF2142 domain-containing protein [uncultured Gemmiger sp.]|uniref:DUF2142 domain-containing protein n=1 Tax=uncultured Gemmiger sp. TaxID=1623490 RepID=UPI0026009EAF|nr:DUF2142 domain-containing protein [uncultured Gemmiger sp.]